MSVLERVLWSLGALAAPWLVVALASMWSEPIASVAPDVRWAAVLAACCSTSLGVWLGAIEQRGVRRALLGLALLPLCAVLAPLDWRVQGALTVGFFAALAAPTLVLARGAVAAVEPRVRGALLLLATLSPMVPFGVVLALGFGSFGLVPARFLNLAPRASSHAEQAVARRSEDGLTLRATYTPGRRGGRAVVLVHGVADGRTRMLPLTERFAALGFHVLRIDLRANGASDGAVCTYGAREGRDIAGWWHWLRARPGVAPSGGVILGASMGGASVLSGSPDVVQQGVTHLVALAPASDYEAILAARVAKLGPLAALFVTPMERALSALGQPAPWRAESPASRYGRSSLPLLVLHGDADPKIPLSLSRRLVAASPHAELRVLPGVDHDGLPAFVARDPQTWAGVRAFVEAD